MSLLPPAEARARILAAVTPVTETEEVGLREALGRTLARDLIALRTQPPFAASAMDGYAVRAVDVEPGRPLRLIGEAAAGHPFAGEVGIGQTVRIFTGAPLPEGADAVVIQENVARSGELITPSEGATAGRFVRPAGLDFETGSRLLSAGVILDPPKIGLAASMGHAALPVRRRPRVALVSTGDELAAPGAPLGPGQIVSSNAIALSALIDATGGQALDLGIVPDESLATRAAIHKAAAEADLVVTCGGASVGDRDLVQAALVEAGFSIEFWKVALRPGKPFLFGAAGDRLALGLPGNPVSSYVCALLFLVPAIRAMLGHSEVDPQREPAILARALPANDLREEYLRARLSRDGAGRLVADPFPNQDSSIQRVLASADALIVRQAHAAAADSGDSCEIIRL